MKKLFFVLAVLAVPVSAFAGEAPAFLSGDRTWGSTPQACKSLESEDGAALTLSRKGIYGYEFGCNFLDFLPVRDDATGEMFGMVAIASCGDDSGISRPDMFNITVNENTLSVTSQNEYTAAQSKDSDGQTDPFATGIIEKPFEPCK